MRTERTIWPASGNTLLVRPNNLLVEGIAWLHILKGRPLWQLHSRITCCTVQERCHSLAFNRSMRTERTIWPASGDILLLKPRNVSCKWVICSNILKGRLHARHSWCTGLGRRHWHRWIRRFWLGSRFWRIDRLWRWRWISRLRWLWRRSGRLRSRLWRVSRLRLWSWVNPSLRPLLFPLHTKLFSMIKHIGHTEDYLIVLSKYAFKAGVHILIVDGQHGEINHSHVHNTRIRIILPILL